MPEEEGGGSLIHVVIKAERLFNIGPFEVTNSMVGAVLASLILLVAAWYITRNAKLVPGRLQIAIEFPIDYIAGITASSTSRWRGYVSLVIAIFLMLLVANWIGLMPGVGTVGLAGEHEGEIVPFIRPAAADLNFTLALSLLTFGIFVWWAIRVNGPIGYLKELVGEPRYLFFLMFPIHVISELSRIVSLSMRLFGNIFAGEVLITTMLALTTAVIFVLPLAFVVPALFLGLEVLIGVVQALVFALLAMTYITIAIAEHEGEGHGADKRGADPTEHGASADTHQETSPA
jgi:F-type H+-transporting ATPase subunit a